MLPFLKKSQESGVAGPVESVTRDGDDEFDSLEVAAEDLIAAVHSKSIKGVAAALRAAFELCDEQPHSEGPE